MWECKHCNKSFDFIRTTDKANHGKHCPENPTREIAYKKARKRLQKLRFERFGDKKKFHVSCSNCETQFQVFEFEKSFPKKDKYFCSRKCSNSVGGKAKVASLLDSELHYTTLAWRYHKKECIVCSEKNVVAVHHYNEKHDDDRPENLVPLCPTHHQYMHSKKFKSLIVETVDKYVRAFGDRR